MRNRYKFCRVISIIAHHINKPEKPNKLRFNYIYPVYFMYTITLRSVCFASLSCVCQTEMQACSKREPRL